MTASTTPKQKAEAKTKEETWSEAYDTALAPLLSESAILQVKEMFVQGIEPPFVPDSGWGSRKAVAIDVPGASAAASAPVPVEEVAAPKGRDRGGRGGRGGRGDRGRGRGRGGRSNGGDQRPGKREDTRRVITDVSLFSRLHRSLVHRPTLPEFKLIPCCVCGIIANA